MLSKMKMLIRSMKLAKRRKFLEDEEFKESKPMLTHNYDDIFKDKYNEFSIVHTIGYNNAI